MSLYDRYVLPKLIDVACSQPPMTELRQRYVPRAAGDVLEIGVGSGLNLAHYSAEATSVTGLDPAAELTGLARERAKVAACEVQVMQVSGEDIPVEDARFDSVVCTWTLCTIPNVYRAAREMFRVLKPGGSLYFVEHGRSPDKGVARMQGFLEPMWKKLGGGCHLTRRADELLQDAGFALPELDTGYVPGPRFASFMIHGVARKPT